MLTTKKPPDTTVAPHALRDDAAYSASADKLEELKGHRVALDARRAQLSESLHADQSARNMISARATRLIEDGAVPLAREVDRAALHRGLVDLEDELAVVRRAVELQEATVERERRRVSETVCARLRPQHRAIVTRIDRALSELVEALAAEKDFRERLIDLDFAPYLRPMPLGGLHDPRDTNNAVGLWRKDAHEHGLLQEALR